MGSESLLPAETPSLRPPFARARTSSDTDAARLPVDGPMNHPFPISTQAAEEDAEERMCTWCSATKTPLWRAGPAGPRTLCNACGVRYTRMRKNGMAPDDDSEQRRRQKRKMMAEYDEQLSTMLDSAHAIEPLQGASWMGNAGGEDGLQFADDADAIAGDSSAEGSSRLDLDDVANGHLLRALAEAFTANGKRPCRHAPSEGSPTRMFLPPPAPLDAPFLSPLPAGPFARPALPGSFLPASLPMPLPLPLPGAGPQMSVPMPAHPRAQMLQGQAMGGRRGSLERARPLTLGTLNLHVS